MTGVTGRPPLCGWMSPSLSTHLIEQFTLNQQNIKRKERVPFQSLVFDEDNNIMSSSNILESGNMSYNSNMHGVHSGTFTPTTFSPNFNHDTSSFYQETTLSTLQSIATLQAKLNLRLGPEYISQRPAPGSSGKLSYIEGWKIIGLANEVFGFNGWSSNIVSLNVDFCDFNEGGGRYNVGVTAIVRVTLRDGVYHEDVGYGLVENLKSKGQALDKVSFILPSWYHTESFEVQERSSNRRTQTHSPQFR